jgi:hypothetical protein
MHAMFVLSLIALILAILGVVAGLLFLMTIARTSLAMCF